MKQREGDKNQAASAVLLCSMSMLQLADCISSTSVTCIEMTPQTHLATQHCNLNIKRKTLPKDHVIISWELQLPIVSGQNF